MVNHGISTAALMLVAGFLISRRGSRLIADFGGVQKVAPVLAGTFLVGGLAPWSLPGLAPSSASSLVLVGTFSRYRRWGSSRPRASYCRAVRAGALPADDDRPDQRRASRACPT